MLIVLIFDNDVHVRQGLKRGALDHINDDEALNSLGHFLLIR